MFSKVWNELQRQHFDSQFHSVVEVLLFDESQVVYLKYSNCNDINAFLENHKTKSHWINYKWLSEISAAALQVSHFSVSCMWVTVKIISAEYSPNDDDKIRVNKHDWFTILHDWIYTLFASAWLSEVGGRSSIFSYKSLLRFHFLDKHSPNLINSVV